jgi:hypothetical protein
VKLNRVAFNLGSAKVFALLCGMILSMISPGAFAATARAQIAVSVFVQRVARVEQAAHGKLIITASDIQRGYVDVAEPLAMRIASNSPQGYALDVLPVNDVFTHIVVRGMGSDVILGADGGMIVQRWQHAQNVSLNLRFQFALRSDIQPGEYSFPLQMAVRPL